MAEKQRYIQMAGPFGLDRRDSAIVKQNPSVLYELENFLLHNGALEVREGQTRWNSSNADALVGATYRVLSLHRYYGLDANEEELKEFYAAVDGNGQSYLKKWNGSAWTTLELPPGTTLSPHNNLPANERPPSLGNFEQFKDRVYYTNQKQPVLMLKKEDDQVYEAGVPEADQYLMLNDCEVLTESAHPPGPSEWTFYTDGAVDKVHYYRDGGFERHTEGDYGITMEQHDTGATLKGVYQFDEVKDLEWFYKVKTDGVITTGDANGVRITDTGASFTNSYIGLQVKNTTTGGTAVVTQRLSPTVLITTPVTGGTDDEWGLNDTYVMGSISSENDYLAMDIFRFTKPDIDEVVLQFSSVAPDASGDFTKGFSVTIYADSDYEHFTLKQRTMLAAWAINANSNILFFGRFRKSWFIHIDETPANHDDWSQIKYMKVHVQQNAQTVGDGNARITIDNIRLLKTPPLPAELKLQVSTCDAQEQWTVAPAHVTYVTNDPYRATEGVSCKKIEYTSPSVRWNWPGTKDLSLYDEGTSVDGSDMFTFDIGGTGALLVGGLWLRVTLVDINARRAIGDFTANQNFGNMQQREIHIQDFEYPDDNDAGEFDWTNVDYMNITNVLPLADIYIDNIRIQPAVATKMINRFIPTDLIIFDQVSRGIEHLFGENSVVDTVVDWLFSAYSRFTRQTAGQGSMVYPDYQNGRYKLTEDVSVASLQLNVDAGGMFSVTFIQDDDLTQYQDFNNNMDGFWFGKQKDATGDDQWWGADWVEVPATDNDEFSVWVSVEDITAVSHITFRFYTNKNADWQTGTGTHQGTGSDQRVLVGAPGDDFTGMVGRRIRNDTTEKWGIVGWVGTGLFNAKNRLAAWGVTWSAGDQFTIDRYSGNQGFIFDRPEISGTKPIPDADNYYEYVIEVHQLFGKQTEGVNKAFKKAVANGAENEEVIESIRELAQDYGVQLIYQDYDPDGEKRWKALLTWKRSDFIEHFSGTRPWASWQCIAAHEIIVRASSKKACTINFQDLSVTKKGGVTGELIQYKVKLEDELGFVGPASEASRTVTVKGSDILVSDIIIPYDTRIKRKRLYRTDATGTFRYLATIDRLSTSYLDQIPSELLGDAIEPDTYKPPIAAHMRKVDNRMAYIDCIDRRGTRRSSRIHLSLPFIPHQTIDSDCFDLVPEDGQKVTWCEWYFGYLLAWKERSFYTIDTKTFDKDPRSLSIGCIAPLSVAPIPTKGFGWLSHEGVVFGDHSELDTMTGEKIWNDIKGYTPQELSHAVGFYHDQYYYIFLGLDDGVYNTKGYAIYIPTMEWAAITGWNVQAISQWTGGTDNNELYVGSNYGYVNRIFNGENEISDDGNNTQSRILSALRCVDFDNDRPYADKYLEWIVTHMKNLAASPTRRALVTITPYYDQNPTKAMDDLELKYNSYKKYDLCVDPGYEDNTTLVGLRLEGRDRYAIKQITLDITDQGHRPNQILGNP